MAALSTLRLLKVATPATAATVLVPDSVPMPLRDNVTFAVLVVRKPLAS